MHIVVNKAGRKAEKLYLYSWQRLRIRRHADMGHLLPRVGGWQTPRSLLTTGAYNYIMSSHYNMHPKPPVVFVHGKKAQLVARRETYLDIMKPQLMPKRFRK
ncbi:MAG: hypothetical protein MZU97_27325 [Bacillus subtilis]|nr:hypothetical protein [Bacillus subtilis]